MDSGEFSKEAFFGAFARRMRGAASAANAARAGRALTKVPKSFARSIDTPDAQRAWQGYKTQATRAGGGAESLLLYPAQLAAEKMLGKERVQNALWKYVSVPWRGKLKREVERSSALGPLTKARDIAEPIIVGVGLEKGMKRLTKGNSQTQESSAQDQKLREKVASVMLHLHQKNREHEKRAHAERIFWKQVERGMEQPPESYGELQTKLASLVNEDLNVLEKAVELAGGQMKLGELDSSRDLKSSLSPSEKFQAELLD
jgi:hypothetical protein